MSQSDTVVVPGKGEVRETARLLLSLADHPRDVLTQGNGTRFSVPEYLAARYERAVNPAPKRRRTPKKDEEES